MTGTLMDKETGKPVEIDKKEVTAETTFTPKESSGTVDVIFSFDGTSLAGKTVVVFESATYDGKDYAPLNVYGQTKLDGELAVANTLEKYFIVRIAWVFGVNGKNFIKTMLNAGKTHDKLTVVSDQIGTPTYTLDLSRLLVDMIETDKYGYYHATNEGGYISWYDFTKEIFKQAVELGHTEYSEDRLTVVPVTTAEYGVSKAARPFNSRLDKSKLVENGFKPLPTWQDALHRYLQEIEF
jgi:dTDP-4-dehydrorhamnose reductase